MAFNRLVDREIDADNPRTEQRELPRGVVSVASVRTLVMLSCGVFVAGAAALGPLPLMLSPVALALALGYSYTKRFTALCHVVLGLAVAFAPGGAWIAVGAPLIAAPYLLVLGVATWVAGFDVLYSLQDRKFDRRHALHSIPVALGVRGALAVSLVLHIVTVGCLFAVGFELERGVAYLIGVGLVALLLAYEHAIVKPNDLSRIDKAFFDLNGYVSLGFLICVLADQLLS
jgi:4-hydroxybenzoate polyprenyltransferase